MNWKRVGEIARWEYIQKVRTKGFLASMAITPLLLIGIMVLQGVLLTKNPDSTRLVGVIDQTGRLFEPLKQRIEGDHQLENHQPIYSLVNYLTSGTSIDSALAAADHAALSDETNVEGTFVLADSAGRVHIVYRSPNPSNERIVEMFESEIERIVTEERLTSAGIDTALYNRILTPVEVSRLKVTENGTGESSGMGETFIVAYIGLLLLAMMILTTGQQLVRSLVEEKSNRIIELLVSSMTPVEMIWGKLIGLTGLGFTLIAGWIALGSVVATYFSARMGGISLSIDITGILPLILPYVFLGYFFYSSIFIGIGSLASTEQGAQTATGWLSIFLLAIPLSLAVAVMQEPDAGFVRVLSYIPLFTPSIMMMRIVTKMPETWEIIATLGLLSLSTAGVAWLAGKIFRTAILLHGKRPSVREIGRWLKQA